MVGIPRGFFAGGAGHFGLICSWVKAGRPSPPFTCGEVFPLARKPADKDRSRIFFIAPAVLWLLAFTLFPLLYSLYLSLHGSRFLRVTHFVGLENYLMVLTDYRFWQAFRVTLIFVCVGVTATTVLGLLLALLFNHPIRGIRLFRTLSTIPLFTAPVAIGYLCMIIFYEEGGPINNLLLALGMNGINWISDPFWAKVAVVFADTWQWTPFAFLVLLAALQAVPDELYEAAALDTVSSWQTFVHITLPMIRPALSTVVLLRTVEAFKIFDIAFSLTNGGPGLATRTLTFNVYTTGLRDQNLGEATAIAFLLVILMLSVTFVFFRIYRSQYE
ncbi:MAG TPA: sugar ABC transporter permease [Bacillota bacterium]|nr:sugar ABC transporter permease [Bacillota bacterium]